MNVYFRNKIFGQHLYAGLIAATLLAALTACSGSPQPGPDKVIEGTFGGALVGAGAGAVTGAQISSAVGPGGAAIGAGFGAALGSIQGFFRDRQDEKMLELAARTQQAREVAYAQEVLTEHFKRRAELYPTRDIFPADIFFESDTVVLKRDAYPVVREIVRLNKDRMPWSRLIVTSYIKSADPESKYATHLAEERARNLSDAMIRMGIEPRRLTARGVLVTHDVVQDPADRRARYAQVIELSAADR